MLLSLEKFIELQVLMVLSQHSTAVGICVVQSNVIEAAPDMRRESEKEWYYGNADKERLGPYSFDEVMLGVVSSLCIIDL